MCSADCSPAALRHAALRTRLHAHRQVLDQIMVANLNDTDQSWYMDGEGDYRRVDTANVDKRFSAHAYFMTNPSLSGRGHALKNDQPPVLVDSNG